MGKAKYFSAQTWPVVTGRSDWLKQPRRNQPSVLPVDYTSSTSCPLECGAPAIFQHLIESVTGLQWEVYMCALGWCDSVLLKPWMGTWALCSSFNKLCFTRLKQKPSRCHLLQLEVKYLGHVVTQDGIQTDPDKTCAVEEWPVLRLVRDMLLHGTTAATMDVLCPTSPYGPAPGHDREKLSQAFHQLKHHLTTTPSWFTPTKTSPILDTNTSTWE